MRNLYLLFLLLSLFSCSVIDSGFTLQKIIHVECGYNCVTEKDCFYMDADSNKFSLTMFYSYENGSKQLICTMDYADMQYESTLHSYKSKRYNSHVIFWKIEHEFCPTFKVYYLENGRLTNVGDWRMYTPCKTCDAQDYSLTDVKIKKKGKEMELLFSRDVVISDYDKKLFKGNWMLFNAGTLILTFNTKDGQLRKK